MKKKLPLFYKIYFSLLTVFALALVCFLSFLYRFVLDYDKGLAETVSQEYFDERFASKDYEGIIKDSGISPNEFETKESIINCLTEELNGKLSFASTSSNDDSKGYIIKSNTKKIGNFSLTSDDKGDFYFNSLDLECGNNEINVRLLDTSSLYVNGKPVGEQYITLKEAHENAFYLEGFAIAPQYVTYTIGGFYQSPSIEIYDKNGNISEPVLLDNVFCETIIYTDEEEVSASLLNSAKEYAKCMQNEVSKWQTLKLFVDDSEIYSMIRDVETSFAWDHNGSDFTDISISEFYRYDENTVSVKISFNHVLKFRGKQDHIEPLDKTYFATNASGKYLIFAMK